MFDGRPNSELILATGRVEDDSVSDYLTISVGLVQADRMFSTKKEILKAMGFEGVQVFCHSSFDICLEASLSAQCKQTGCSSVKGDS